MANFVEDGFVEAGFVEGDGGDIDPYSISRDFSIVPLFIPIRPSVATRGLSFINPFTNKIDEDIKRKLIRYINKKETKRVKRIAIVFSVEYGVFLIPSTFLSKLFFMEMSFTDETLASHMRHGNFSLGGGGGSAVEDLSSAMLEAEILKGKMAEQGEILKKAIDTIENTKVDIDAVANKVLEVISANGFPINYSPTIADIKLFKGDEPVNIPFARDEINGNIVSKITLNGEYTIIMQNRDKLDE